MFTSSCHSSGEKSNGCTIVSQKGVINKSYLVGDKNGQMEEMYLSEVTFFSGNCSDPLFTITKKNLYSIFLIYRATVNSRSVEDDSLNAMLL